MFVELQLILLTFSTGIQDAISFPDFQCFASNQTGNTVVLAVASTGLGGDLFDVRTVAISLSMFLAGAVLTGQAAHFIGPTQRLWLVVNHFLQTGLAFGAAAIAGRQSTPKLIHVWTSVALLAFSSGAQVASMRPLRIPEITTAMATAAWVDLVIDANLFVPGNRSRDLRLSFLISLVAGSFAGAFMRIAIGSSNALIVSASVKLFVTVSLLFNRAELLEDRNLA